MARCSGCESDRCSCVITAGQNISVTGSGRSDDPYEIAATGAGGGGGGATLPPGCIMAYGGPVAPSGWLLCNGASVSRTGYPALWGVIGTIYGPGTGPDQFSLPDLQGRMALGNSTGHPIGSAGGREQWPIGIPNLPAHTHPMAHVHSLNNHQHIAYGGTVGTSQVGNHKHGIDRRAAAGNSGAGVAAGNSNQFNNTDTGDNGAHAHTVTFPDQWSSGPNINGTGQSSEATTQPTGGGQDLPTMPPYQSVAYIIKT